MDINKENFYTILQKLDKMLDFNIEFVICGGISGLIFFENTRPTKDIDILNAHPKISQIKGLINQIGEELGLKKDWINDGAKGFSDYLMAGYLDRAIPLDKKFKHLKVSSIFKADFFVMKLASGRPYDLEDIENFKLSESELEFVDKSIQMINQFERRTAMKMDLFMEEYNAG